MNESIKKLGEGLNILGISSLDIKKMSDSVRRARTKTEAELIYHNFKLHVRKKWKLAVFELHPDRGGDEAEFKKIVDIMDILDSIEIDMRPRPMKIMYYHYIRSVNDSSSWDL